MLIVKIILALAIFLGQNPSNAEQKFGSVSNISSSITVTQTIELEQPFYDVCVLYTSLVQFESGNLAFVVNRDCQCIDNDYTHLLSLSGESLDY